MNKQSKYEQLSIAATNHPYEDPDDIAKIENFPKDTALEITQALSPKAKKAISPRPPRSCSFGTKIFITLITFILIVAICTVAILTSLGILNIFNNKDQNTNNNQCKDSCCVFCYGSMLDVIQHYDFFNDSKYFVDMEMKYDPNVILNRWNTQIMAKNLSNNAEIVQNFTINNFNEPASDITDCTPIDYDPSIQLPEILKSKISDDKLQTFASSVYHIWPKLCKSIKESVYESPNQHSLLPLPHSQMIVAGGRFREVYYWDSYWIIHGLLVSNMTESAKWTVDNLMNLTATYGHMLNGNRIYYQNRSQPPLLTLMVDAIYEFENKDSSYIMSNLEYLQILKNEYLWWMNSSNKQVITINGRHKLNLYHIESSSPRPEGYLPDEEVIHRLKNDTAAAEKRAYSSLRSGAESGWDYTSRWCISRYCNSNMTNINTINVIPVELNAYMYHIEVTLAKLFAVTGNNADDVANFTVAANNRLNAINEVLYDAEDKRWRDYDIKNGKQINEINKTTVSSYIPLWLLPYDDKLGIDVLNSLNESGLIHIGGISTTNVNDSQQWDHPNSWPPMTWIIAKAAEKYNTTIIGNYLLKNITQTYINAAYIGLNKTGVMHEKYNVFNLGSSGNGGEYNSQTGFGWSNGVALSFLYEFGNFLTHPDIPTSHSVQG